MRTPLDISSLIRQEVFDVSEIHLCFCFNSVDFLSLVYILFYFYFFFSSSGKIQVKSSDIQVGDLIIVEKVQPPPQCLILMVRNQENLKFFYYNYL